MRRLFLIFILFALSLNITSFCQQTLPAGRWRSGGYFQARNQNASISDSTSQAPLWPITTSWGEEIYVSDSTWSFFDPRIAVGDTILHVFGEGDLQPIHYRSTDNGNSWQYWATYHDSNYTDIGGVVNVFSEPNRLYATWVGDRNNWSWILFRSSTDNGATWPILREIRVNPYLGGAKYGNVSGHKDTAFVSFVEGPSFDSLAFARTTNRGNTWPLKHFITGAWGTSYYPSLCYAAGIAQIAFERDSGGPADIFYLRSIDHGQFWSEPIFLGFDDHNHGQWPELSADSFGNVAIVWMDYNGSPYPWTGGIWCRVSHDYGATWPGLYRLDNDYLGSVGTTVLIEGDYLAVCWASRTSPHSTLHVRESYDGGVDWGDDQTLAVGLVNVPRLAKKGAFLYLIWDEEDGNLVNFIKFMRNDLNEGIKERSNGLDNTNLPILSIYPNPFNSTIIISLSAAEGGDKKIAIYDITGALIKNLDLGKSGQKITWDATDNSGQKVCSGIYFARVLNDDKAANIKLIYLK